MTTKLIAGMEFDIIHLDNGDVRYIHELNYKNDPKDPKVIRCSECKCPIATYTIAGDRFCTCGRVPVSVHGMSPGYISIIPLPDTITEV